MMMRSRCPLGSVLCVSESKKKVFPKRRKTAANANANNNDDAVVPGFCCDPFGFLNE